MKRLIALLLVFVMAFALVACDSKPAETKPSETKPSETTPSDPAKTYTWDVTVVYEHYDAGSNEYMPKIVMTEKADANNTVTFNYYEALASVGGQTNELKDKNDAVNLTGELKTVSATFNENDWTITDEDKGSTFTFEVVTPLTEGDYDTHGELKVNAKAKDYVWNVTVEFDPGAEGTYKLINPGLAGSPGWTEEYVAQEFIVSPEENTFRMIAFTHQPWTVDNLANWYQWVIEGVDVDFAVKVNPTVTKRVAIGDRHDEASVTLLITRK